MSRPRFRLARHHAPAHCQPESRSSRHAGRLRTTDDHQPRRGGVLVARRQRQPWRCRGPASIAFNAAFALEINTTGSTADIQRMVLDANFAPTGTMETVQIESGKVRVFAGGSVTLGSFAAGKGAFVFERAGSGRLVFLWGGELTLKAGRSISSPSPRPASWSFRPTALPPASA